MNILKSKTLVFVLYLVGQSTVRGYLHWRSAEKLGTEAQNHELRKETLGLGRSICKEVVRTALFDMERLVVKK